MAVNLKNVKDTVNLAVEVLGAAAAVIEGAKELGVDVDAVGGAVKDAAGGAANGARAVADGIGKGFGAAADGVGAAVGALGGAAPSGRRGAQSAAGALRRSNGNRAPGTTVLRR